MVVLLKLTFIGLLCIGYLGVDECHSAKYLVLAGIGYKRKKLIIRQFRDHH